MNALVRTEIQRISTHGSERGLSTVVTCWTMDIFISWSGPRSRAVAEALKEYLPLWRLHFEKWAAGEGWNNRVALTRMH